MRALLFLFLFLACFSFVPASAAPADESFFLTAQPVWPKGEETTMNLFCGFKTVFASPEKHPVSLYITGSSVYRIFINGTFIGHGPARAGHGYYRVDCWNLTDHVQSGKNALAVEAAGYNVNSFYLLDQPAFLQAEVRSEGKVLASTKGHGAPFEARIVTERERKVQRYSFQRTFIEYYRLSPGFSAWRSSPEKLKDPVECAVTPDKPLIPRRVSYPLFYKKQPVAHHARGSITGGITPARIWKDRSLVNISPQFKGYPEKELSVIPTIELQKTTSPDLTLVNAPYDPRRKTALSKDSYHIVDLGLNLTGFFGFEVACTKPLRLYVTFDEILRNNDVDFKRLGCANVVCWELAPGTYHLETFEPYTLQYLKFHAFGAGCTVKSVYLRELVTPDADAARFASGDPKLNRIFEAARETFRQNSLDIFMDCPSRERAGWLCDSFFTSRVAFDFSGNTTIETNFFENFLLPDTFKHLPKGIFPMCYPADQYNGNFIPNWAMWFVVQLEEYYARSGDRKLVDALEPKVMDLFSYFSKFINKDGLLEKLEKWVFVEWSAANSFVQDVNYPSNMLYTAALEAASRLYSRPELAGQAQAMRKIIYEQSYDGEFFVDNAVRKNGTLTVTHNRTEVCQYFAFFFNFASPRTHKTLWTRLRDSFGPTRDEKKVFPGIHKANAFIGNYLRIELLSRYGNTELIKKELTDFYIKMAKLTGTLWENIHTNASCNHGFASHLAHSMYRDLLGIYAVDAQKKEITLRFTDTGLPWCRGQLLTPHGPVTLSRSDDKESITFEASFPAGYRLTIENKTGKALKRQ